MVSELYEVFTLPKEVVRLLGVCCFSGSGMRSIPAMCGIAPVGFCFVGGPFMWA